MAKTKQAAYHNYIIEYNDKLQNGEITACEKVKKVYKQLAADCNNTVLDKWHFDIRKATRPIVFIERFCRQSKTNTGQLIHLELFQKAALQAVFGFVDKDGNRKYHEVIWIMGRKNGKALSLDTEIPTPAGWKLMRDIHPGDYVYGTDGKPHEVIAESETFNKPMYLVEFEDGTEIKASGDHLWTVETKKSREVANYKPISNKKRPRQDLTDNDGRFNITTAEMAKDFVRKRPDGKGVEYKYRVPMTKPIEYEEQDLPISPYILGLWLGDGNSSGSGFTCGDMDKAEADAHIKAEGYDMSWHRYNDKPNVWHGRIGYAGKGKKNEFLIQLRNLDEINNKHIPDMYMHSSIEQRLALLQGLMDTDGYCSKCGQCEFSQKNTALANQVSELLSSLGIKNTIHDKKIICNNKECHAHSILFFTTKSLPCFRLKRKADRLKDELAPRMRNKSIVNITQIATEPSKCICIDSKDHLYLAGRGYTATHNSTILSAVGLYCMLTEPGAEIDCVATKRDQAKIVFDSAVAMVKQSPDLARIIHKRRTDMTCEANLSVFQPLASDSNTMQGLNASCGIIDELSSIKDNEIYTAIKYSQSARPEPLLIEISTNGTVRECIFDQQYDYASRVIDGKVQNDRLLPLIYELDSPEEWTDEDCWIKANPGLGTIKSRADLRQHVEDAKHKPSEKRDVLVYDFNVKQTDSTAWLSYEQLWNPATFVMDDVRDTYAIGGADLSATTDLTCASLIIHTATEDIPYVLQQYFLPEKRVKDIETLNTQEAPYRKWAERGLLTICPGSMVDYHMVTQWFKRMRDEYGIDLWKLGYDRAMANYWKTEMEGEFGQNVLEPVAQGPYTWSQPMKELGSALTDKRLNYNGNPMLAWCISNTGIKTTGTLDVIQPVKIHRTGRIDGLVSLLNAWVIYDKYMDDYFNLIGYDGSHYDYGAHNTILN